MDTEYLEKKANLLRRHVVEMITQAKAGHIGGALSCADIITALYFHVLRLDPNDPRSSDRDRFILSKGHSCPVLYAALAERGFFPREELRRLRAVNGTLQGHPCMRKTPGIDMSTGSLGHGLSLGVGMALAGKLDSADYRVYVLLSDGEMQEGQVWEAAMAASHYELGNLIAIVDRNGLQFDGSTEDIMSIEPLRARLESFGWSVCEIDGHDMKAIVQALEAARSAPRPSAIIAHTTKGRGVSYMENQVPWHAGVPTPAQYEQAMSELGGISGSGRH